MTGWRSRLTLARGQSLTLCLAVIVCHFNTIDMEKGGLKLKRKIEHDVARLNFLATVS